MRIERLGWLGTRTDAFNATVRFFRETLGLAIVYEEPDFTIFGLPGGTHDLVEVIGPAAEDSALEAEYYKTGPVVGFVVDDIQVARAEIDAAGFELVGEITWSRSIPEYGWFHFRGPDGNLYGMLQGTKAIAAG